MLNSEAAKATGRNKKELGVTKDSDELLVHVALCMCAKAVRAKVSSGVCAWLGRDRCGGSLCAFCLVLNALTRYFPPKSRRTDNDKKHVTGLRFLFTRRRNRFSEGTAAAPSACVKITRAFAAALRRDDYRRRQSSRGFAAAASWPQVDKDHAMQQ